jgi:hypothetical protein
MRLRGCQCCFFLLFVCFWLKLCTFMDKRGPSVCAAWGHMIIHALRQDGLARELFDACDDMFAYTKTHAGHMHEKKMMQEKPAGKIDLIREDAFRSLQPARLASALPPPCHRTRAHKRTHCIP